MQPVGWQRHGFRQRPIVQPQEHASQLLRQLDVDPLGVPHEESIPLVFPVGEVQALARMARKTIAAIG